MPDLALSCLMQVEHVSSECNYSDANPLSLALHSLQFHSASQTLRRSVAQLVEY